MLDPDLLLNRTEAVASALAAKGTARESVVAARDALVERRSVRHRLDELRAELNRQSKVVGEAMKARDSRAETLRVELSDLKSAVREAEQRARDADQSYAQLALMLPNLPDPEAPVGLDESDNIVLRHEGTPRADEVPPHWEIAEAQGWWEPERAARMSGSGFAILRGDGARLLRALPQYALNLHRDKYTEFVVPHMMLRDTMVGTGHLPKFADDAYATADDRWLIPTGEVPLTAMHRDEILDADSLPLRYTTYTVCFRREAGAAGKDTRGMQRLHEFHKVELMIYCQAGQVTAEFAGLLHDAETSLRGLGLPYRVVDLATGDLTFSSARIHDLEVHSPGVGRWLEASSVGNFSDFQARRSHIRMKDATGKTVPVHTLNGSALATPRVWAALLENGYQADGTVRVPEALTPNLGTDTLGVPRLH
ncbi:MAG: serine--tRNA ligase [Propionibacteriaceae bacterium]|nr:serine--tRNA ligase [Propionibacteriaceae bacterium]